MHELLELAVHWKIVSVASDFWKRHKSRDALIHALQHAKDAMELAAKLQEMQPMEVGPGGAMRQGGVAGASNSSAAGGASGSGKLEAVGELFAGGDSQADLFGTRGEIFSGSFFFF